MHAEVAATFVCRGCGERVFPVSTSKGEGIACGCIDEDGSMTVFWELGHKDDYPTKWEWDEQELDDALRQEVSAE